jgi:putative lumazine-binding protein
MSLEAASEHPAPDRDEIVRVMHIYTDNWSKGDPKAFEEAFHQDAWMFFTERDGTLVYERIWDCFEDWASPDDFKVELRIISVTQAGDVANVLLGFDDVKHPDDSWVDLHNLLRIDGTWTIMNKTATHASRADWAAPSTTGPASVRADG